MSTAKYSVIIPAHNAAATLGNLLVSLQQQTFSDFEAIVIDDASTDATPEIAAQFKVRCERLTKNVGPAAGRNRGVEVTQGEWLVFTDADMEFMPDTMEKIEAVVRGSDADAFTGTYSGEPANRGFAPRYKALWSVASVPMRMVPDARGLVPLNTWGPHPGVVRRSAFQAVGGFDTRFRGADLEDMELGYRLAQANYKIYFVPSIQAKHHFPESLGKEIKAFARRSALWMRMWRNRRQMDSAGEGSLRQALGHLCGFAALWLLIAGLAWWPFAPLAGLLLVVYIALHWDFIALCIREEGIGFAAAAIAVCLLHTMVLGFAAAYGLITPRQEGA